MSWNVMKASRLICRWVILSGLMVSTLLSRPVQAQVNESWLKEPGIRVDTGASGSSDSTRASDPDVIQLPDGRYRMYYTGHVSIGSTTWILSATSADGLVWIKEPGVRLTTGGGTALNGVSLDETQTIEPSVIRLDDGMYWMYYGGHTTSQSRRVILRASSTDGLTWTKDTAFSIIGGQGVVPDFHVGGQEVIRTSSGYRMYFSNYNTGSLTIQSSIMVATSADGLTWQVQPGYVLTGNATTGTFLYGPAIRDLGTGSFRMYFSGIAEQAIYSATSTDDGNSWLIDAGTRLSLGAPQDYDSTRIYLPEITTTAGVMRLYYTGNGPSGSSTHRILSARIVNEPPDFSLAGPVSLNEGQYLDRTVLFTDPDEDAWTVTIDYGDGSPAEVIHPQVRSFALHHLFPDNGAYSVCVTLDDGHNAAVQRCLSVSVENVAPAVTTLQLDSTSINENDISVLSGAISDPGVLDQHSVVIDWGDGSQTTLTLPAGTLTFSASHRYLDDNPTGTVSDVIPVQVTVTDKDSDTGSGATTVTVKNVSPAIVAVAGPTTPLALGVQASISATFSDVGSLDTHSCVFSWDDGQQSSAAAVTGACSATHTFGAAGVYSVGVAVTDDDTGSVTTVFEFVIVYDPSAGFVTGGGWINSPAGAYKADPSLTGKATFGFVSKYKKGASVPTGNTEFHLQLADFNFSSAAYEWLVVAGSRAQYRGTGTINGSGNYGFLLTAVDGDRPGGGNIDKLRIKIWNNSAGGVVVYDNVMGVSDDIDAANPQALGSGSIIIHD